MAVNSMITIDEGEITMPIRHSISEATQQEVKSAVHRELLKRLDLERLAEFNETRSSQQQLFGIIHRIVTEQGIPLSAAERDRLTQEVLNEVFGLGPIEPLLHDPTVSDILVNTWNSVYVERRGLLEKTNIVFKDNRHLMHIIEKIVSAVGRRVDEMSPMVDARLPDGSRVNAIIPPLAIDGPILSIRRFGNTPLTAEDLIRSKMLAPSMLEVLRMAVEARLNIVVSGGTGAGKTTLLNVLSGFISGRERIVTVEDSAELLLRQEHVVRLETRPPNLEGHGAIRQRELIINALRMRPDRIVVGEVRGEETLDMLQAMNTGHDGSITTIHANSPRDAVARLETMAMMANVGLPEKAIRNQIASAVHLIVQVARMSDGSRRITHIAEVVGTQAEIVALNDLYLFERKGTDAAGKVAGRFYSPGILPRFAGRLHDIPPQALAELLNVSVEV
ncbi:pilus assembly protein CpaF [Terriglobus roseus]|uniref:Pilus assembly protein CpaF n=2 Tax=Terriglobus roseus TaxID=392734 RepID=A0A1G7PBE3_9BACT|nr:pilus assembly protein CpaF [Terriglobus roseus]